MASSKNKKKSQAKGASAPAKESSSTKQPAKQASKQPAKASAKKASQKKEKAKKKGGKPGFFARIKNYFGAVKTEMRRVVWPSRKDLVNYSVAVIVSLVVVGVAIAGLDAVIEQVLVLVSGLGR